MTYEDLRRVPRLGKSGMRVIRKVLDLGMPNSRPPHALARPALATVPQRD
jgi:hypothetical protein